MNSPKVTAVFDGTTNTASYVAVDPETNFSMPKLVYPSVQINMRAGEMPPAEDVI